MEIKKYFLENGLKALLIGGFILLCVAGIVLLSDSSWSEQWVQAEGMVAPNQPDISNIDERLRVLEEKIRDMNQEADFNDVYTKD